jgi:hypothetical protein
MPVETPDFTGWRLIAAPLDLAKAPSERVPKKWRWYFDKN